MPTSKNLNAIIPNTILDLRYKLIFSQTNRFCFVKNQKNQFIRTRLKYKKFHRSQLRLFK